MTNIEKYNSVFCSCFGIDLSLVDALEYQSIAAWDSVGHMGLIANLEDIFDIMMEMDDIIDFSSYQKGMTILSNYNISF
jgi:acyl carrier protein